MKKTKLSLFIVGVLLLSGGCAPSRTELKSKQARAAERMIKASEGRLAPVYAPLAEQIVRDYKLADKQGIGIDLGSGPGSLIIELCKRTKMHWIDADINPYFFPYFYKRAGEAGFAGRVSAVYADAQSLPFRNNYADMIVSRGSYHFWGDKVKAFGEIYRVLKPSGVAFIGRGFADEFPLELAKKVRAGHKMNYDKKEKAQELQDIMSNLGISSYRIRIPKKDNSEGINYGIWIEIHKVTK